MLRLLILAAVASSTPPSSVVHGGLLPEEEDPGCLEAAVRSLPEASFPPEVRLSFVISETGQVADVAIEPPPRSDVLHVAEQALRRCRFVPRRDSSGAPASTLLLISPAAASGRTVLERPIKDEASASTKLLDNGWDWSLLGTVVGPLLATLTAGALLRRGKSKRFYLEAGPVPGGLVLNTGLGHSPLRWAFLCLFVLLAIGPVLIWWKAMPRGRADIWCGAGVPSCRVVANGETLLEIPFTSIDHFEVARASGRGPAQLRAAGPLGPIPLVNRWPEEELRAHAATLNQKLSAPSSQPVHLVFDWEAGAGNKLLVLCCIFWPFLPLGMLLSGRWTTRIEVRTGKVLRTISWLGLRRTRWLTSFVMVELRSKGTLTLGGATGSGGGLAAPTFRRVELLTGQGKRFALTRWLDDSVGFEEVAWAARTVAEVSGLPLKLPDGLGASS